MIQDGSAACGVPASLLAPNKFDRFDSDYGYILDTSDMVHQLIFVVDEDLDKVAKTFAEDWKAADGNATPVKKPEDLKDARTLPVKWSANSTRTRPFVEDAQLLEVSEMDAKDFLIEGPRSLAWFVEQMANGGSGTPSGYRNRASAPTCDRRTSTPSCLTSLRKLS